MYEHKPFELPDKPSPIAEILGRLSNDLMTNPNGDSIQEFLTLTEELDEDEVFLDLSLEEKKERVMRGAQRCTAKGDPESQRILLKVIAHFK